MKICLIIDNSIKALSSSNAVTRWWPNIWHQAIVYTNADLSQSELGQEPPLNLFFKKEIKITQAIYSRLICCRPSVVVFVSISMCIDSESVCTPLFERAHRLHKHRINHHTTPLHTHTSEWGDACVFFAITTNFIVIPQIHQMLILPKTTTHTVSDALVLVGILESTKNKMMRVRRVIIVMSRERPGVSNNQKPNCLLKNIFKVIKNIAQVPLCCPVALESTGDKPFPHEQDQCHPEQSHDIIQLYGKCPWDFERLLYHANPAQS